MAKMRTKTFAEKMLKALKPPDPYNYYQVIRPVVGPKGAVRFSIKNVKVVKGQNEEEQLGL